MMLKKLERELEKIYNTILDNDPKDIPTVNSVDARYRSSAINLYRYLVLRSIDIRKTQGRLSELGISSLGSGAGYVFDNVSNALKLAKLLAGKTWEKDSSVTSIGYLGSQLLLQEHVNALFNIEKKEHDTKIMVTMPDEAVDNLDLLKNLMLEGMKVARINLSHGNMELWQRMLDNIHLASETLGLPIKIYMDLPGPKIRVSDISTFNENNGKWVSKKSIAIKGEDQLCLRKDGFKGYTANLPEIDINTIPQVSVSLPQIIDDLQIGHRVFFDDGAIEAKVVSKSSESLQISIINAYKGKLRPEKGINLPDTSLSLPSLTHEDLELLPFVGEHADVLGFRTNE